MAEKLEDACTPWGGSSNKRTGYGNCMLNGKVEMAHRVAYIRAHCLSISDIKGFVVRHRCDNRICVNPNHLEIGTHTDNNQDTRERGRWRLNPCKGEMNGNAKLTAENVKEIRRRYVAGSRTNGGCALGREFGVSNQIINAIVRGLRWTSV